MRKNFQGHVIYETDNADRAREVASNNPDVSVVYNNPNVKIPPVLISVIGDRTFTKRNPQYVEYLKRKHPGISEQEINECIKDALNESLSKTNKVDSVEHSQNKRHR